MIRKCQYIYISEELQSAYEDWVRYISSGVNCSFFKTWNWWKITCGGEWLVNGNWNQNNWWLWENIVLNIIGDYKSTILCRKASFVSIPSFIDNVVPMSFGLGILPKQEDIAHPNVLTFLSLSFNMYGGPCTCLLLCFKILKLLFHII